MQVGGVLGIAGMCRYTNAGRVFLSAIHCHTEVTLSATATDFNCTISSLMLVDNPRPAWDLSQESTGEQERGDREGERKTILD